MATPTRARQNDFHEWLISSAYVKGPDQTSRVVSRKKHRSKRNSAIPDLESAPRETEERIRVLCKVSNRHYRRWMNDRLLRELGPPLDAQEIGSLFAPPPWGEKTVATPLERITSIGGSFSHDMAAWEPFRNNVDMDAEEDLLHRSSQRMKRVENSLRQDASLTAWRNVPRRCRDVLRRSSSWPLVEAFEKQIIDFLTQEDIGARSILVLDVDDAYHRLLLHGICEFYGLASQTISTMEDREGNGRIFAVIRVHIKKTTKSAKFSEQQRKMPLPLTRFLAGLKKVVSY